MAESSARTAAVESEVMVAPVLLVGGMMRTATLRRHRPYGCTSGANSWGTSIAPAVDAFHVTGVVGRTNLLTALSDSAKLAQQGSARGALRRSNRAATKE